MYVSMYACTLSIYKYIHAQNTLHKNTVYTCIHTYLPTDIAIKVFSFSVPLMYDPNTRYNKYCGVPKKFPVFSFGFFGFLF